MPRPSYINPLTPNAFEIVWPEVISPQQLYAILAASSLLEKKLSPLRTQHTYNSLTVFLREDCDRFLQKEILDELAAGNLGQQQPSEVRLWEIPFCAEPEYALDLEEMAGIKKCTTDELVAAFCDTTFTVYFEGFLPGFFYLGSLPPLLQMPRLTTPRAVVPAGAVALAGSQAGIYPQPSPGGWRIIGKSPVSLIDLRQFERVLLPGDWVKFRSIAKREFKLIESDQAFRIPYQFCSLKPTEGSQEAK